jgi:hypothetical protein
MLQLYTMFQFYNDFIIIIGYKTIFFNFISLIYIYNLNYFQNNSLIYRKYLNIRNILSFR